MGGTRVEIDEPSQTRVLLDRLRSGDRDALVALFDHYRPRLQQMLRLRMDARVAARFDASDVLQEAYLDAARQIEGYLRQPQVALYVWLRELAWERLLNLQRQHLGTKCRAVEREVPLPGDSSALLAKALLAPGPSPSQALVQEELRRRLQRALEKLKAPDREVLLMRHYEDMSNGEVAQALGLSASAATMRYGRALFRLKEILLVDLTAGESRP
jgi:RNA polymerase sigma-70 factor (ECF subfamily)